MIEREVNFSFFFKGFLNDKGIGSISPIREIQTFYFSETISREISN
jgi:hypothetical protein